MAHLNQENPILALTGLLGLACSSYNSDIKKAKDKFEFQ